MEVRLRDVEEGDLPIFFEHQRDPDATRMAAFPARDQDAFMAHWTKILGDESITKMTILVDGRVAGNIARFEQSGEQQIGYWIGKEYWGRGVATRALSDFLDYVQVRPLHAHVAKHNIASIRVLEKCGFTMSGEAKGIPNEHGEEVEELVLELRSDDRG
ncbi:MAG: GNAT family N-acetyltransferase [Thermoplasmata archaeon]